MQRHRPVSHHGLRRACARALVTTLVLSGLVVINLTTGVQPAHAALRNICNLMFIVQTGKDGLRDDSIETITFGRVPVLFRDANGDGTDDMRDINGDGVPDPVPSSPHTGGTHDTPNATFRWSTTFAAPCVSSIALLDGFTFHHTSPADDLSADNWNLQALQVIDMDTNVQYVNLLTSDPDHPVHRFYKNSGQTFNTNENQPEPDTDHDGLTDREELRGIPKPGGTDTFLPDNGADPCRKSVAVELDFLDDGVDNDGPSAAALAEARTMFDNAPVSNVSPCPYGTSQPGVQLLIDRTESIRADRSVPLAGAEFDRQRAAHFSPWRAHKFFYSLWGRTFDGDTTSGFAGLGPFGNDFAVTLGRWQHKSVRVESATFVHELGHVLGLQHGGDARTPDFKPNYLSVMNGRYAGLGIPDYSAWQAALRHTPTGDDIDPDRDGLDTVLEAVSRIDYSRSKLPTLHPDRLAEGNGVGGTDDQVVTWWDDHGVLHAGAANESLDWDWSGGGQPDPGATSHADLLAGIQVCVSPTNPASHVDDGLRTTPAAGDEYLTTPQAGRAVVAGPDGICTTPPDPADTLVRFGSYPDALGYAEPGGITGFDDWSALKFRVGDSPDANAPLPGGPGPGPTEAEHDRDVTEIIQALLAQSTPAPSAAPRWAYAYMDRATTSEAPIGVPTALNNGWQWSTARTGSNPSTRVDTVTHLATGEYEVRLADAGAGQGVAHATAYRTLYKGRSCAVRGYHPDGADELVRVGCADQTGAPVDWWFTVLFATPATGPGAYATVRYQAPGGTASPGPIANDATTNSAGNINRVYRDGVGQYRAVLVGTQFAADTGYVQLSQYGSGPAAHCQPYRRTPVGDTLEISIACDAVSTAATAQPIDTNWVLSYTGQTGLHDDAATPSGYVTVAGDPAAPAVDAGRSWASDGETPAVVRRGPGWYRVTWSNLGKLGGNVQVTSTSPDGWYCHLGAINDYSAPPQAGIDVWCHNPAGNLADSGFGLAYLRRP